MPLLVALLAMSFTRELLVPLFSPLAQQLGLPVYQLGLVLTVASVAVTLSSPLWGWALDAIGLRSVLLVGLGLGVAGMAGYAAVVTFGLDETLTPGLTFTFMLAFRSVLLGAGFAVLPVAALAVAGTVTVAEGDRTRAMGLVGAAQGLAALIGPQIGSVLALITLSVPLYLAPVLALLIAVVVVLTVKPVERPQHTVQTRPWELLPTFGFGFLMYLSFGLSQVAITAFLMDRLKSSAPTIALGGVAAAAALGLVVTQGVVVPLLRWPAAKLMRAGAPIAVAGYAVLAVASSYWLVTVAFLVVAAGVGLAVTGFAAAASLGVGPRHQGLVAGLVCATSGLTIIVGSMLSGMLYDVTPVAPVIAAGVAAALAGVVSLSRVGPGVPQSVV